MPQLFLPLHMRRIMAETTVTLWSIDQCQHSYEAKCRDLMLRQLIEKFGALEGGTPFDMDIVFGMRLPGAELDLVAFLPQAVVIGDMKEIYGILRGEMNGPWYVERDRRIEPLNRKENPWEQVRRYRSLLLRETQDFERRTASRIFKVEKPHAICRAGLVQVPVLDLKSSIREAWWYACGVGQWIPYLLEQEPGDRIDLTKVREWLVSIGCERSTLRDGAERLGLSTKWLNKGCQIQGVAQGDIPAFETELDDLQKIAVAHSGERPVVIMAGPGSGKTAVVVERARFLRDRIREGGWMAVVSYTNSAADEIRSRMKSDKTNEGCFNEPFVGTFHSFVIEVLRRSAIGSAPRSIIDEHTATWRYACCCGVSEIEAKAELRAVIGDPISVLADAARDRWNLFLHHLRIHGVATFESLLYDMLAIVDNDPHALPDVLIYDEFQDVSPMQGELVRKLAQRGVRITVVGDPEQSIFGFNGCSPDSLISFARESSARDVMRLGTNYRSHGKIVDLARALRLTPGVNLEISSAGKVEKGGWEALRFSSDREQMRFVADWVIQLNENQGVVLDEIAILFRGWKSLDTVAAALESRSIPYRCDRNREGMARPLKELISLCLLSSRLDDPETLFGLLEVLPRISNGFVRELLKLENCAEALTLNSLRDSKDQLTGSHRDEAEMVLKLVDVLSSKEHTSTAEELTWLWRDIVKPRMSREEKRRADKLEETVELWCHYLGLRPDATGRELRDALAVFDNGSVDEPAVHLGTIHSAKGKQWLCVVVVDVCDDTFLKYTQDPAEEIRLLHVAFSRAIAWLLIGFPERRGFTPDCGVIASRIEELAGSSFSRGCFSGPKN